MLIGAITPGQKALAGKILQDEIGVQPSHGDQYLFWVSQETNEIEWVVGYTNFLASTCQMHVYNAKKKYTPRKLLWAAFDYPFNRCGVKTIFGVVNSLNAEAMRYDAHLGFVESARFPGVHDDGGDMVLFSMNKADCRWIKESKNAA